MSKFPDGRRHANASSCPFGDHAGSTTYPISGIAIFSTFDPSEFIWYSTGSPPRSLTNMICAPVFGVHTGEVLTPRVNDNFEMCPPSVSETKIPGSPCELDINAIFDPSGDHAGEVFVPRNRGKLIIRL